MIEIDKPLSQLPKGWVWSPLGEIVSFEYGRGLREDRRDSSGNVPVFGSNGIVGHHSHALVFEPCLIIGRKGAAGTVHISKTSCWPIDTTYYVIPPKGIDLTFLYHLISSLRLVSLDKSTAIPGLNRNDAYTLNVPIPPTQEQQRIVAKIEELFTDLDTGMDALIRAKTLLNRYRQSVLKAAVTGELTKEWREAHKGEIEPASVLLERILAERRKKWEEKQREKGNDPKKIKNNELAQRQITNLPELPEEWTWANVEEVSDRIVDCFHSTPKFQEKGVLCLDSNWMKPGKLIFSDARYVDETIYVERIQRMKPQADDVVFSREGAKLGIAVKIPPNVNVCLGQRVMIIRLARGISSQYFEYVLNSITFRSQYFKLITGTASPHLNIQNIKLLGIPLPSNQEQVIITQIVEEIMSIRDNLEIEIDKNIILGNKLRQSILRQSFIGRLIPQEPNDEPASVLLERIRKGEGKQTI
jgi:type I restriction enzyme S subunit